MPKSMKVARVKQLSAKYCRIELDDGTYLIAPSEQLNRLPNVGEDFPPTNIEIRFDAMRKPS